MICNIALELEEEVEEEEREAGHDRDRTTAWQLRGVTALAMGVVLRGVGALVRGVLRGVIALTMGVALWGVGALVRGSVWRDVAALARGGV